MVGIQEILKNDPIFQAVLRKAKKQSCANIHVSSAEKWNNPYDKEGVYSDDPDIVEKPREDGHFDVEGHTWTDIYCEWDLRFWHVKDLYWWVKQTKDWIKDSYELGWDYFKEVQPFNKRHESWVWTIESFEVAKSDLAESLAEDSLSRRNYKKYWEEIKLKKEKITDQELLDYVAKHSFKLSGKRGYDIYCTDNDPTVICVNEKDFPYDLKNGWSDKKIAEIIQHWFYLLEYRTISVKLKNNGNSI